MSSPSDTFRSLLHRLGVAGPVRLDASQGSGAPSALLHPQGTGAPARVARRVFPAVFAALLVVAVMSAPARAERQNVFGKSFGQAGPAAGQMEDPTGVAVNDATHDIYVADTGNHRVDEFDP